jgi:tetratricopeptide (TPR) repeat protein
MVAANMEISTDVTQISALNALLTLGGSAPASSGVLSAFGPAAILSLGGTSSRTGDTYSYLGGQAGIVQFDLAGVLAAGRSASGSTQSQQLTEAEVAELEDAFSLIEQGALGEAESALDKMLSRRKTNAAAVHALGLIEVARRDFGEAEKLFRRADFLARNRGYGDDAENARILQREDDYVSEQASLLVRNAETRDRGISLLLHLADRRPNDGEVRTLLAESLFAKNDLLNGMAELFRAVDVSDESQLKRIEDITEGLIKVLPKTAKLQRLLGRTQLRLGKFEEALASLDAAAKLAGDDILTKSDSALAYVGIGHKLLEQGDVSRAITNFEQAKALSPADMQVREGLAEGLLARADRSSRLGNQRRAIQDYSAASRMLGSMGSESLRKHIAGGAYAAGLRLERESIALGRDLDEEALAFQAAYDLDSDNLTYKRKLGETRNTLGDQFMADEDYKNAMGAYRRAHDLYMNDDTYEDNLINAGQLYGDELLSGRRFDEAVEIYRETYKVDLYNDTSKLKLANAYNERGLDFINKSKPIQAVKDFKEALALFPDNAEYQANYNSVSGYDN